MTRKLRVPMYDTTYYGHPQWDAWLNKWGERQEVMQNTAYVTYRIARSRHDDHIRGRT